MCNEPFVAGARGKLNPLMKLEQLTQGEVCHALCPWLPLYCVGQKVVNVLNV